MVRLVSTPFSLAQERYWWEEGRFPWREARTHQTVPLLHQEVTCTHQSETHTAYTHNLHLIVTGGVLSAQGRVALTELKVISSTDKVPFGYAALTYTHDDSKCLGLCQHKAVPLYMCGLRPVIEVTVLNWLLVCKGPLCRFMWIGSLDFIPT